MHNKFGNSGKPIKMIFMQKITKFARSHSATVKFPPIQLLLLLLLNNLFVFFFIFFFSLSFIQPASKRIASNKTEGRIEYKR